MKADYYITITLDTRKPLADKNSDIGSSDRLNFNKEDSKEDRRKKKVRSSVKYPVKLQVYTRKPKRQKLWSTEYDLSINEFETIWKSDKSLRGRNREIKEGLEDVLTKAKTVAKGIRPFSVEQFEKKFNRRSGDGSKLVYHYGQIISEYTERGRMGSVNTYNYSMESLKDFTESKKNKSFDKLEFVDITPAWLNDYEQYMIEDKEKSITSVGIYLRALKAIFNKGIDLGEVHRDLYPFGKRKYQIPTGRNTKKALTQEQLKKLFEAVPATPEQERAKDFWFFSYAANGMNPKDIALLKYKNIQNGRIEFIRAKTKNTTKAHLTPIVVYLNDYTFGVIEKYGTSARANGYVFDILKEGMTPAEIQRAVGIFVRFINQHIKRLAKANGLPKEISCYWARHSYATNAIRQGASMEFMQESLGHSSMKVTQNYFAGFDDESKKEFANKIMKFE